VIIVSTASGRATVPRPGDHGPCGGRDLRLV